ncbi:hypothetical protein Tco_1115527 [Tanacetum coccineum]
MAGNTVKDMTTNFGKLDKFEGHDFRRWQKKMHFLLTTLKVFYVLTTPMLELLKNATAEAIRIRAKWENDDYICRGHILNDMSDSLFDVYMTVESAKELCDSLESKYMAEDASSKKFLESDKGKGKEVARRSVNMTEEGGKNKHHKQKKVKNGPMRTTVVLVPTRNQSWNVGSAARLVTLKGIAVVVKRTTQMLVVRERGLRTNPKTKVDVIAWWIDSGATTHVCKDRCWFKTYEPVEDGYVLYMGDDHFAPAHGKGSVALEFSSGKTITLFYVIEPNEFVSINSIIESRDAIFDENRFSSIVSRKGKRVRKAKSYGYDFQLYLVEGSRDQVGSQYYYCYSIEEDPRTYDEAMQSWDVAFWKEAIDDEIGSIMENNTWVLSDLPTGCKPLGAMIYQNRR